MFLKKGRGGVDKEAAKKRQIHEASRKLPSTKRRRLQLKEERSNIRCANEVLEGDTYASGKF